MSNSLISGQRFRTFNMLDDHSRETLTIEVDTNLTTARVILGLERIAAWRGCPAKLRMDTGPEFISAQLAGWAEQDGVELEFIQPGKRSQTSYMERFNHTFRNGILNIYVFSLLCAERTIADNWILKYCEQRPRESLSSLTPSEFVPNHAENSSLALH